MRKSYKDILKILLDVSRETGSSLDINSVSDTILKHAKSFLRSDHAALFILDDESKKLMLLKAVGLKSDQLENLKILGSWEKINEEVVKKQKPFIVNDILKHPIFRGEQMPFFKESLTFGAFLAVPLKKENNVMGVIAVSNSKKRKAFFTIKDKKLLIMLANHVSAALLNAGLYKKLKDMFLSTVESLVTAIDARDPYTSGHSRRVSTYVMLLARELKLDPVYAENLKLSALLHDVGKIGVKDSILSKKTKLSEKEIRCMRCHPEIGARIVSSVKDSLALIKGIEDHHEFYAGGGYPKNIKAEAISQAGKIIAVVDAFDTITTNRPYQKALTAKEAFFEIAKNSGRQFDPKVVKAFQLSFSKYPDRWHFK